MNPMKLAAFSLLWIFAIYLVNCLIAREFLTVNWRKLFTYALTMAALGLFGEIVFDWAYKLVLGRPLWVYHLLPIHGGFTSLYSLFLWGMVGVHLYFLHATLGKWNVRSTGQLAVIFCLEAIVLEALANISYGFVFGGFIYYYLPSDLWHITSLQTLPLYLLAGYITVLSMRYANRMPRSAIVGNTIVLGSLLLIK